MKLRIAVIVAALALAAIPAAAPAAAPPHVIKGGGVVSVLRCKAGPVEQVDPIVVPDGGLSSHLHQFFGGEAVHPVGTPTTAADLRSGPTSCPLTGDTSGYWVPVLLDADGASVRPVQLNAYYRSPKGKPVRAFPQGFGLVCGNTASVGTTPCDATQVVTGWGCIDSQSVPTIADALPCPHHLVAHVQLKSTDDGFPKVSIHATYPVKSGAYHLSSDLDGMVGGSSLHADFLMAWKPRLFRRVVAALNAGLSCKGMTDTTVNCLPKVR